MKNSPIISVLLFCLVFVACTPGGHDYHVSPSGSDANDGSNETPFQTISAAAAVAEPGDIITVHEGVYRERVNPPRGGTSDKVRITYQAADGELVVLKGSKVVNGWEPVMGDTWKVLIPNSFFGTFNPYQDVIAGDWFNPRGRVHHTGAVYVNGHWLTEAAALDSVMQPVGNTSWWYAEVDSTGDGTTTIWAQFMGIDPNMEEIEINVRQSVFYPEKTGINYLTIRGFTMEHAATPWAPPTAEQIGLVGTNWSKGWIIEGNIIRYSTCVGITLGKHGDEFDNTSANSAEGYVKTIERAVEHGWSPSNIGHHIVRNNQISACEQAGLVGSMGAVFSEIYNNEIFDIHIRRLFSGAEMAGIKIHGSIDCVIRDNHIYRSTRGIWLDWMTQGTRVTGNFLHDNGPSEDLFLEVNHGPALIDNNLFLSPASLLINSQGEAFAHNIIAGRIYVITGENRLTPYHKAHATEVVGLAPNRGGDERYYNNILVGDASLDMYDHTVLQNWMVGNVDLDEIKLTERADGWYLEMRVDKEWVIEPRKLVTTELLGMAEIPGLPFEQADGQPYRLDRDFFGQKHDTKNPFPGPFVGSRYESMPFKVWPRE